MMKHKLAKLVVCFLLAIGFMPFIVNAQTCSNSITATTPTADFNIYGDGTVTHNKTGLMWQRCSEGQFYINGDCYGSAIMFTWAGALQRAAAVNAGGAGERHGYTDWRLPNKNELESIVEQQCVNPAINVTLFPNTGASGFWSSSPGANFSRGWAVYFSSGGVDGANDFTNFNARLVRGGQSIGSVDGPRITQAPMEGPLGTQFTLWASGLTPNSTVTIYTRNGLGEEYAPFAWQTTSGGSLSISYIPPMDTLLGPHTIWVVDDTTGRLSDSLGYMITGAVGQANVISTGSLPITLPPIKENNDFGELTSEPGSNPSKAHFDPRWETFIVVHGWNLTDSTTLPEWVTNMGKDIKDKDKDIVDNSYNVLYWNWQEKAKGTIPPFDTTGEAGRHLAEALLNALPKDYDQPIHFIGHSLGTLVSAHAVKSIKRSNRLYAYNIKHMIFLDYPIYNYVPVNNFMHDNRNTIFFENYMSLTGLAFNFPDADVNAWLFKAAEWDTIRAHEYSHEWYRSSVTNFNKIDLGDSGCPSSIMPWGFYWQNISNQSNAEAFYYQAAEDPHYELTAGLPTAWDFTKWAVINLPLVPGDAVDQLVGTQLTDFAKSTKSKVMLMSLKTYDTATDIAGYTTDVAGHALQEVIDLKGHLTLTHASTAVLSMPVDIPTTANQLTFGLEFLYSPPDTLLEVFINNLPMYQTTSELALGEGYQLAPWINVEQFAGQSVTLSLRLSNPNSDTKGKVLIDDLMVARIEPGEADTTTTTSLTLPISLGWNLLSSAIGFQASEIFSNSAKCLSAWKWKNGTWAVYLPDEVYPGSYANAKGFSQLTTINPGDGFWLNASGETSLTIPGTPVYGAPSFDNGWNLVGLKSNQSSTVADFISDKPGFVSLWKWENGTWAVYLPGEGDNGTAYAASKGFAQFTAINPGEGFWVYNQ